MSAAFTTTTSASRFRVRRPVTLGALTLYIIGDNGLMLGGWQRSSPTPASVTISGRRSRRTARSSSRAIQIAGAAGLLIAAASLSRPLATAEAIVRNARRAGTLIAGVASMLVVAGTIEGFVSPQRWPRKRALRSAR